jgi:hypothetical protein
MEAGVAGMVLRLVAKSKKGVFPEWELERALGEELAQKAWSRIKARGMDKWQLAQGLSQEYRNWAYVLKPHAAAVPPAQQPNKRMRENAASELIDSQPEVLTRKTIKDWDAV